MLGNPLLLGDDGYRVQRSVRLRASAGASLSRTPSVAGNQQMWTWSGWLKRGAVGAEQMIFTAGATPTNYGLLSFLNDTLRFNVVLSGSSTQIASTTAVFRDPSAWYHIVLAFDSAQPSGVNGIRVYVNGQQQLLTIPVYTQFGGGLINGTAAHYFGVLSNYGSYLDGLLSEVHFIDGQALTPAAFGATDPLTGQWLPKKYTGTYGTNGFYLNFADNSAATAAAIGKDSSGNGNNWTPANISVTAGATYDSMLDVPTMWADGGNGRGNYCTLNPLNNASARHAVSQGNLAASLSVTGDDRMLHGTVFVSSGKWYFEYIYAGGSSVGAVGIATNAAVTSGGGTPQASSVIYFGNGAIYRNAASIGTFATYTTSDVIGVAFDLDALTVAFYKNNTLITTVASVTADAYSIGAFANNPGDNFVVNFGQRPFAYTPPTGFKALHTGNISTGAITTSGSFVGNVSADGPSIYLNGVPTAMTINGNPVTFGTHADKTAYGFKVRSSSASYNAAGTNTFSVTTTGAKFKFANAQGNP